MYFTINYLGMEGVSLECFLPLIPFCLQQKAYQVKQASKGSYIYPPFQNGHNVYLIKKGRIKVSVMHQNEKGEYIQYIAEQGELFGDWGLFHSHQFGEFAQAMEETSYYQIPIENMQQLMQQNTMVRMLLLQMISLRYQQTENRLFTQLTRDIRSRIINFLLKLVEERGEKLGDHILIKPFFLQSEIGGLIGCSAQSVGLVLRKLRLEGIIDFNKKQLTINKNLMQISG